jgi:hypothetical protein
MAKYQNAISAMAHRFGGTLPSVLGSSLEV